MSDWLTGWLSVHEARLIDVRRDLHAHPELGYAEVRTTALIDRLLRQAGLEPHLVPDGTGLWVDIGAGETAVGLRADIDALPLPEQTDLPFRSTVDGVCHACGHDVHTTVALGAALALASCETLPGRVRVMFQPAEELLGGAHRIFDAGGMRGVRRVFALHCDPRLEVGRIGTRVGAITAACDQLEVHLSGPGGHTARPHLTVDLVDALARIVSELPGLVSRQVDPRAAMSIVFGSLQAGVAPNAIPSTGVLRGTVRVLDRQAWDGAEGTVRRLVEQLVAPSGAKLEIDYRRGVPPVVNEPVSVSMLERAIRSELGEDGLTTTEQSMGGEDFGWYADHAPLAMGRLGVHSGGGSLGDLHQGTFLADERAIGIGVRVMATTALNALAD